jgi:Asp-tRNA(Asn)/Glu-tRNA(Gln) amidotransferase C subunit
MSQFDFLLSEKPQQELLPYSQWSEGNQIADPVESRKEYADYLRSTNLDNGTYDETVENEIREGLYESVKKTGQIDPEDELAKQALFQTKPVSIDEQLKDAENTLPTSSPDWEAVTKYRAFKQTLADNPDAVESFKASGEEYRVAAEEALSRSYDDVLRSKIRNNEIPFAKVTGEDGKTQIIASDLATKLPLKDAIKQSKNAGVGLADAYWAQQELKTQEGYTVPNYKLKRIGEAASMIETLAKEDDDVKSSVDGYARRLARTEYDFGDVAGEMFDAAGQTIVNFAGRVMGKGKEIDAKEAFQKKSDAIAQSEFSSTAESIARKLNTSGALRESEAFTVGEVQQAMNEIGLRTASNKGYFQFHDGAEEIGKNIRNYGIGLPVASPALMANKEKFDQALAARTDISDTIKKQMEGQRQQFLDKQFPEISDLLSRTDVGDEWQNELQKARAAGQKDRQTLETFLSNPDNYSEFAQRAKGVGMSIIDGFGQLAAALPAILDVEFAQDYLSNVAQQTSDRRELANLFGVDMGVTQEVAESLSPMLVDMTASTILAALTSPVAGIGGAGYLAAKQGARLTVKGIAKGLVSNVFKPLAGESIEAAGKRLVAEGLIKQSVKDGGVNGAMAAINGYSGQLANRLNITATSFIPAANRSMGASYGAMFNQLQKDPNLTREEAHERALGGAITSGIVTGLITSAFSGFGKGGLETALTRGLSYREMKTIFSRLSNSADNIPNKVFNDVIKTSLKDTFKKYGYASIGKNISKEAFDEGTEEALDQFVNSFVQDATLNENTSMLERLNQTFHAFVIGGVMGAGVPAIQSVTGSVNRDVRNTAARNLEFEAIKNVTSKLNESGSPLTAEIVGTLLTGPVRRQQAMAEALRKRQMLNLPAEAAPAEPAVIEGAQAPEQLELPLTGGQAVQQLELPFTGEAPAEGAPTAEQLELSLTEGAPAEKTPTGQLELPFPLTGAPVTYAIRPKEPTPESIVEGLSGVTPEAVEELISVIRPEEVDETGQMDFGMYIRSSDAAKEPLMVPFSALDFGRSKQIMEQLELDFTDVVQSEISEHAASPTRTPKAILPSAPDNNVMVEGSIAQFAGEEPIKEAELSAFNRVLRVGFPISFQSKARFGMPARNISKKATGQESYYINRSNDLANLVYKNFPVTKPTVPANGSEYSSGRKITYFDPISGTRVESKPIKGALDADGNGVFNNDPVLISEMLRDGVPVKVPRGFAENINPSFVIRNRRVVDVLGPRPDGKAGLVSMTAPIERSTTSEPDYTSLFEAGNLATLFLDDVNAERVIPSGAPVIDQTGKITNIGSMATSVGEMLSNFNQFILNATMPEVQEGARVSGVINGMRIAAASKIKKTLKLRNGTDLESGFFDTALQALHTEYINFANLFEIRSSLISSKIAVETPTGYKINPAKQKGAVKLFMNRLRPEQKTTIAERLAPFIDTSAQEIRKSPDKVMLKFLDSEVLNNGRFEGNTMPTLDQLADTIKGRYADQQKTREIEEKVKATTSMDPTIMDQVAFDDISKDANYIGEPSISGSDRMSASEVSRILKGAEFNALNAIDENPDLRDALNDLLFQSIYKNPSTTQVTRVTSMTTADAFGTLANWIAKGNYNNDGILSFERSLRDGEFASGYELRSALTLMRLSSRANATENPTEDAEFVSAVQSEISRSLGRDVPVGHAKDFIKAIDKSIRKRMSRSHITQAQSTVAKQVNTADVETMGLVSGDPESVITALKNIAKSSKNKSHKLAAELLLEDEAFIKTIRFEIGEADLSIAGEYNRLTDGSHSVFLNLNGHNGRGLANVMLEEYVHAFVSDTLNKPKELLNEAQRTAVTRLNGLMELVRKQADLNGITDPSLMDGLANIDEFVASFLLSKKFQSLVKSVEPQKGQRGFFGRIVDALVSMFRRVTAKEKDAYTEALKDIIELSRSAMGSERNTSASLLSSVSEDASDILNRAADVRDALPESVKSRVTQVATPETAEQAVTAARQEAIDAANNELVQQQQKITEENVPKSDTETNADQLKRARNLQALIRSIVPFEVRIKYLTPKEIAAIGEGRRFIASATGDLIEIDMGRLMAFVDGMDDLTTNMLVESVMIEELGHVASYNSLPQSAIDEIVNSFNQSEFDAVADSYYQNEEDRKVSKALVRSENEQDALKEKRRLVEEHLRAHLQRVTTGHTTEENAAFLRTNPSLFKIMLRYIGGVFRRMTSTRTGNPMIDNALTRMLTEMRALKMGYRMGPSVLKFDPNNPTASTEVFRVLTGLDNLDQIEMDGFGEDLAEAMYTQINLEDFKRIQKLSRPKTAEETEEPEIQQEKFEVQVGDIIDTIERLSRKNISAYLKSIESEFDDEFEFGTYDLDEFAAPEFYAIPTSEAQFEDYGSLTGPADDPDEVIYRAAKEFVRRSLRPYISVYVTANNIDVDSIDFIVDEFTKAVIVDAADYGGGPQVILSSDMSDYEDALTVLKSGDISSPKFNIGKLIEVLPQIDGLTIISSSPDSISAKISRGGKNYTLSFGAYSDGNISVGDLVPIETEENSGETFSNDSFGIELMLLLTSNNHLIGAKEVSTYAAGSSTEIREETERVARAKALAAARGEKYEKKSGMVYKGFKAWAKLGFDAMLSSYDISSMVDELHAKYGTDKGELASDIDRLAQDEYGIHTVTQLVHLSDNPSYGEKLWSNGGRGKHMKFDLTAGSRSLRAFGEMIEQHVKIKGLVEEIKPLRKEYSRKLKSLPKLELSDAEKETREKQIRDNYVQQLNKLGVNPDRLLTSLGSGTAFSGSSIKFDGLLEMLEMPLFEAGTYKAPASGFMRAFMGELDPRFQRLDDNRNAFARAAALLVERYKGTLDKLVEKRYGSIANAPNELIAEAMGSTGVELDESVYDRIEDDHTERLINIRSNASLTDDQRSAAIYDSARLRDEALASARTTARDLIVKRKDAALTELTSKAPEIAKHIVDLREKLIDPLSKRLKKDYGLTEEFGVYIDSQLGIYMTRAYRMFNEVGFAERVKQDPLYAKAREKAIEFFDKEFVKQETRRLRLDGMLPAQAKKQAEDELINKRSSNGESYGQQALAAFIESYATKNDAGFGGSKLGEGYRVMLDNLKQKKDIPSELRDILGEYKNSEEGTNNLLRTFVTVATMASNQSFLNNVRTLGERNGFLVTSEEYYKDPAKYEGFVPFRSSTTSKHDPLLGMFGPKEMVEGFQKSFDANTIRRNTNSAIGVVDNTMKVLNKASGYAMAAKTLGSVGFYFRNVVSNMLFFGPSQGFMRVDKMLKVAAEQSWKGLKDQNRIDSYIAELTALDVIGNEIQSNVIRDLLNGKVEATGIMKQLDDLMEKSKLSKGKAALELVVDKASRLAAHADAIYKIAYFEYELNNLKEAQKSSNTGSVANMSEYQLKRMAAQKILMTAQSASQAPPVVSEITKSGLGLMFAPFLRFKAEVPRIVINTYKLARKEMKDANPNIKRRGQMRFASMTTMLGVFSSVLPTALRVLVSGIGDDEDEALRNSIPEYLRGNTFYYFGKGDNLKSMNLTFINPFSMLADPTMRAFEQISRGNFAESASQFVQGMIFNQYLEDQIFAGAYSDLKNNKNSTTGEPIWEKDIDGVGGVLTKATGYLMNKAYSPRILSDAIKAYEATGGDYKEFDDSPLGVMLSGVYPARIHEIDLNKQYSRYLKEKKEQFDRVIKEKYALYGERPVNEDTIRELYDDEVKNRKLLNQDLIQISRGFEGLGMSKEQIFTNMVERGGISKRRAALLFSNIMDRPDINKAFLQGLVQKEYGLERAQVLLDQLDNYPRYMFVEE